MERRQRWIAMRLEKDANRLEITPSQQAAWNAYAEAVRGLMGRFAAHDAAPRARDAASLARRRADRAAAMAAGLSRVADATAALQKVLSPEQRTVFDQMAHRMGSHHHGHHRSGHPHGVHQQGDHHPGRPGWEGPEGRLDGQPGPEGRSGERHGG
jgi:hypothetical protein